MCTRSFTSGNPESRRDPWITVDTSANQSLQQRDLETHRHERQRQMLVSSTGTGHHCSRAAS